MAGPAVYLGNLFTSLNGKMDQSIAKMDSQISKLNDVITAIGSSVSSVFLRSSANIRQSFIHSAINIYNPSNSFLFKLQVNASGGTFAISLEGKDQTGISTIYYSYDGGTTKVALTPTIPAGNNYATHTFQNIPVLGKNISFYATSTSGNTYLNITANSLKVLADVIDVANNGFILLP